MYTIYPSNRKLTQSSDYFLTSSNNHKPGEVMAFLQLLIKVWDFSFLEHSFQNLFKIFSSFFVLLFYCITPLFPHPKHSFPPLSRLSHIPSRDCVDCLSLLAASLLVTLLYGEVNLEGHLFHQVFDLHPKLYVHEKCGCVSHLAADADEILWKA